MQCPNCGNVLSPEDIFCGSCGFHLGDNLPTLFSQRQAPSFYSAPTVGDTGFDVQAAMMALDNPYHSLLPGLTMSNLVLNDDRERVWKEERVKYGRRERLAWYEKNGDFRIKSAGMIYPLKSLRMADFTFQAGIVFHPTSLKDYQYHLNFSGKEKPLIWLKRFCSEREGSHCEKEGTI